MYRRSGDGISPGISGFTLSVKPAACRKKIIVSLTTADRRDDGRRNENEQALHVAKFYYAQRTEIFKPLRNFSPQIQRGLPQMYDFL